MLTWPPEDHQSETGWLVRTIDGVPVDSTRVMHVDEDFLAAATNAALGAVLAHEGFHVLEHSHDTTETYPYTTWPFSLQNQCVGVQG